MSHRTINMTFGAVNFDYRTGRFHRKVDGLVRSFMKTMKERTKELISSLETLDGLTMSPAIFSDDTDSHDCDTCPAFEYNAGDLYDEDVCRDCWNNAIDNCKSS